MHQKPSNVSFDEAASIPLGLATAVQGFYGERKSPDILKLSPPAWEASGEQSAKGKTVVILGGSSSVGQFGGFSRFRLHDLHVVSSIDSRYAVTF